MELIYILLLVICLYARTVKYKYQCDDIVLRKDYGYHVEHNFITDFVDKRPKVITRVWCIVNHCANVGFIYLLFGWQPALIFAVHPVTVEQVIWLTGNYYAGTATLTLAAYTFTNVLVTIPIAMCFYAAALNSTITALGLPFLCLVTGKGGWMFVPLVIYFFGKRFNATIGNRVKIQGSTFDKLEIKKIAFMSKLVGRYIGLSVLPYRLGMRMPYGFLMAMMNKEYIKYTSFNRDFWVSFITCVLFFIIGLKLNYLAIMWFFAFIMPHSQFKAFGQTSPCCRYLYLPLMGVCILSQYLPLWLYWSLVGVYTYMTFQYIPMWVSQERLKKHEADVFPESQMILATYAGEVIMPVQKHREQIWRIPEINHYLALAAAVKREEDTYIFLQNLASFCLLIKKLDEAKVYLKKIFDLSKTQIVRDETIKIVELQIRNINNTQKGRYNK